jgi:hypothetical protein
MEYGIHNASFLLRAARARDASAPLGILHDTTDNRPTACPVLFRFVVIGLI